MIKLGLVGIGKIARDQHVPALSALKNFELASTASPHGGIQGIDHYPDVAAMLAARPDLAAVSLCTPPKGRLEQAIAVLNAGKHLMLEKPPAATVSEVAVLESLAARQGVTIFTTWHSREAAAVDAARNWLVDKQIAAVRIEWREDIRLWHPGQDWILAAGGFGVFDPGINALSIATAILPDALTLTAATLDVPANRASPIAASMAMRLGDKPVTAKLDFLHGGVQRWDIEVDTDVGTLALRDGGSRLELPGGAPIVGPNEEYPRLYRLFSQLIHARKSHVDVRPLQLVSDALTIGKRRTVESFHF